MRERDAWVVANDVTYQPSVAEEEFQVKQTQRIDVLLLENLKLKDEVAKTKGRNP